MYLEPYNRHLLVLPNFKEESDVSFILPEDYKKPQAPYITCEVLGVASDCSIDLNIADTIVIERLSLIHI